MKRILTIAALCLLFLASCTNRQEVRRVNSANVMLLDQTILLAY